MAIVSLGQMVKVEITISKGDLIIALQTRNGCNNFQIFLLIILLATNQTIALFRQFGINKIIIFVGEDANPLGLKPCGFKMNRVPLSSKMRGRPLTLLSP